MNDVKVRIQTAQVKAKLAVNQELVLLYGQIGREILTRQQQQGWGAKVIDQLSKDLRQEFPEMKGFSARNLKYMWAFAEAYEDDQIVQQAAAQIPCSSLKGIRSPLAEINLCLISKLILST